MPNNLKKILIPVLFLFCSFTAFAQPTPDEKKLLFDKIDTLLYNYVKYSRFLESGKDRITPESINDFKQLFVSDAVLLPDDMSPAYFDKAKTKYKVPSFKIMDDEAKKLDGKVPLVIPGEKLQKLKDFRDSLDFYFSGLEQGRSSYFGEYNKLDKDIIDFKAEQLSKEKFVKRSLDEFIVLVEANYPEGFFVKLLNSVVSFKAIENNEVKLLVERKISGKVNGPGGVKLESHDTLLLTLQVDKSYSNVKIANIEMIGYSLSFLNDKDHDFIADAIDACPDDKGLYTPSGCPSANEKIIESNKMKSFLTNRFSDSSSAFSSRPIVLNKIQTVNNKIKGLKDKIDAPPHWLISAGISTGVMSSTFTNATDGYDFAGSTLGERTINPVSIFSGGKAFGGDIMLEHYFGLKSNIGIEAGLAFNSISGNVTKDAFHVVYKGGSDIANTPRLGGNSYTQIITAVSPIVEKIAITNFAIPIMAVYKGKLTGKLGFKVEGGIALNLYYKSTMSSSSTNAKFDYEAVYKYSTPYSSTVAGDFFDPGSGAGFDKSSWLITQSFAGSHTNNVQSYFQDLNARNYPVGLGIEAQSKNTSASFNPGISFTIRPSICFNFNKGASLNIGVFYTNTSFTQTGNYRLIDENKSYNSLMQGVSKTSNSNFGIHISYSYSLFYYLQKWTKELSGLQ